MTNKKEEKKRRKGGRRGRINEENEVTCPLGLQDSQYWDTGF
jgi:hypothetical protein